MIRDLDGNKWKVMKGDPAEVAVKELESMGFRQIIISHDLLMGRGKGSYIEVDVEEKGFEDKIRYNDCLLAMGVER